MTEQPVAIIKKGREKSLRQKHPWVFSGAVKSITGQAGAGATVIVADSGKNVIGMGAYSPHSQIAIRMWCFGRHDNIDESFFRSTIGQAIRARAKLTEAESSNMQRLVFAEADNLPGLIVDRYAGYLVAQFLTAGTEYHKKQIVKILQEYYPEHNIYERSDDNSRQKEGLPLCSGVLTGQAPPDLLQVQEDANRFWVDLRQGHKTGFYIDQSENRRQVKKYAEGRDVLNCFCYTGGFTVSAL